jgi:uncharacterized membrane protein YgcG
MAIVLIDTYKGENPGNFNNPPVNEVLVLLSLDAEGNFVPLPLAAVQVSLLRPSQIQFVVTAVEMDGSVHRVKLAVYDGTDVPMGLNLGYVAISSPNYWGTALCSINLTDALPILPIPPEVIGVNPDNGAMAGGDQVVITGVGFNGATDVSFGEGNSSPLFTVDSDTHITATSPAGAGTVDVLVTNPQGTSQITPADQYTYDDSSGSGGSGSGGSGSGSSGTGGSGSGSSGTGGSARPGTNALPLDCPALFANLSSAYAAWDTAIKNNMSASDIQLRYETVVAAQRAAEPCLLKVAKSAL